VSAAVLGYDQYRAAVALSAERHCLRVCKRALMLLANRLEDLKGCPIFLGLSQPPEAVGSNPGKSGNL
jgi:hypothetical protein